MEDIIILRKSADEEEPWVGIVTKVTGATVKFNWLVEKDGQWKDSQKYDIWEKKDVLAKVKGWCGTGTMPVKILEQINKVYHKR